MRAPRALLLLAIVLLVNATPPGAAAASRAGQSADEVALALNWKPEPQFGGFYAAEVTGAYAAHHLKVKILPGGSGTPTVQMTGAGTVEFGIVSGDELVIARDRGNDVVALFAAFQDCPQGLMVHAERAVASMADVFNQPGTVALQKGLPYARLLERAYGFGKVRIVPSPGGDIAAFRSDPLFTQQVFVTSEPLVARQAGVETRTFLVKEIGYNPYTTVMVARGALVKKHPDLVRAMVAAVAQGWRAYLDDPAAANALMAKLNPAMDQRTFAASAAAQKPLIENDETARLGLGAMTAARWTALAQKLVELGDIKVAPAAGDCFVWSAASTPR